MKHYYNDFLFNGIVHYEGCKSLSLHEFLWVQSTCKYEKQVMLLCLNMARESS